MEARRVRHDTNDEREGLSLGSVACAQWVRTKGSGKESKGGEG